MKNSALQGEAPAVIFSDLDLPGECTFCHRPRPRELVNTWMCTRCKRKSIFELFWQRRAAA